MRAFLLSIAAFALLHLPAFAATPEEQLNALADRYVADVIDYDPVLAYFTGLPTTDHSRFADRTPEAIAAFAAKERAHLDALGKIDAGALPAASRVAYAVLQEQLESDLGLRVCKGELWNVDHFAGWQSVFADVAQQQPVGTKEARAAALKRWGSLARFLEIETANLRAGLAAGYAAPKSVTKRVIQTMESLASAPAEKSPFYSPAERDTDPAFKAKFAKLIAEKINPAIRQYGNFLRTEYLPKARDGIALADLPDGLACYQAYLRTYTTLKRTPREVFDLGERTVAANRADVIKFGKKLFGTSDFSAIVAKSKARKENHFASKEELLAYSRGLLSKAKEKTAALVARMPSQDVVIEPQRDFEEAAGVNSHYDLEPDPAKPATYRIQLGNWESTTRGQAEITLVHEAWPGHHLQIALARELQPATKLSKLTFNSAYVEGWARYAEAMAEEAGIYESRDALILRRVWPARGMVVDPGLHAFGWSREKAIAYILEAGRDTEKTADDLVDRIAVLPGQLTAYDSGGLEIKALRAEAQKALGARFDVRAFNTAVLEQGSVPLSELRAHVTAWIAAELPAGAHPH